MHLWGLSEIFVTYVQKACAAPRTPIYETKILPCSHRGAPHITSFKEVRQRASNTEVQTEIRIKYSHTMHPICTVDQQTMPLGLTVERIVTVTFKEGKMLSSHRTDQTNGNHLLTKSTDQGSKATKALPASTPRISKHGLFFRKLECAIKHLPHRIAGPNPRATCRSSSIGSAIAS